MKNKLILKIIPIALLAITSFAFNTSNASKPHYNLPEWADRGALCKSMAAILQPGSTGSAVAISETHLLTAAHVLKEYHFGKTDIDDIICACPKISKRTFTIFNPTCSSCTKCVRTLDDNIALVKVKSIVFPKGTSFKRASIDTSPYTKRDVFLQTFRTTMSFGLEASYQSEENLMAKDPITGPDVAIIECLTPHGLQPIEISGPIPRTLKTRPVVHILGFGGTRYNPKTLAPIKLKGAFRREFRPEIYAQRFSQIETKQNGMIWCNRVFLHRKTRDEFDLRSGVRPKTPKGFGLLKSGDSGAGCVIFGADRVPKLVGVVSLGGIPGILKGILLDGNPATSHSEFLSRLFSYLLASEERKERSSRPYNRQVLADITHLKPWILSTIIPRQEEGIPRQEEDGEE